MKEGELMFTKYTLKQVDAVVRTYLKGGDINV